MPAGRLRESAGFDRDAARATALLWIDTPLGWFPRMKSIDYIAFTKHLHNQWLQRLQW
jgi:hypothetical protein